MILTAFMIAALAGAPAQIAPNPRAIEFIERDPAVLAWAMARHDHNRDGWLTSFEAQAALDAFKTLADTNRDGRLTVREYRVAVALIPVR